MFKDSIKALVLTTYQSTALCRVSHGRDLARAIRPIRPRFLWQKNIHKKKKKKEKKGENRGKKEEKRTKKEIGVGNCKI